MATLVFGTLGTLVGGPLGGAVGSLIGRALDRGVIGASPREGPRLKELAVSTSTYGQPIARLFGVTRAAGTILWATDLRESRETVPGGKGQPKTTQYSYTVSLAVALSSRPVEAVGRIWADGNLLRGVAGDLKTGGTLRVHLGRADQAPDPLLTAALGAQCPAHRGIAYVVFEDLQLGDFGNRIPALSFEVVADGAGAEIVAALIDAAPVSHSAAPIAAAQAIAGFAHDGGSIADMLSALSPLVPTVIDATGGSLTIAAEQAEAEPVPVPPLIAWAGGEFGTRTGQRLARESRAAPAALRYYDNARDFQPGLQRASGRAGAGPVTLELPATLAPADAAALIESAALRARTAGERLRLRIASLDAAYAPGQLVALPGNGTWRVESWEWRDGGVELDLVRTAPPTAVAGSAAGGDAGVPWRPADRLPAHSVVRAFELPWDGMGASEAARLHVAVGAGPGRWAGAALYIERGGTLVPLGAAGRVPAMTAVLVAALAPSPALMFEPLAFIEVACDDPQASFATVDGAALASGANRLLVGEEIVQFASAQPAGGGLWRLSGLLRGRAGSEGTARTGHSTGTPVTLLDDRLLLFDGGALDPHGERIAAIGAGDAEPAFAPVVAPGRSRRPPSPVHPSAEVMPDGGLALRWTRRARGAWLWADGVDVPLVEEREAYEVGAGPVDAPLASWSTAVPSLDLASEQLAALPSLTPMWVRQNGSHVRSDALLLHTLP